MKRLIVTTTACAWMIACGEIDVPSAIEPALISLPDAPGFVEVEDLDEDQSRSVRADYFIELPSGELLSFYVDPDGSAAVLGELPAKTEVGSVLDLPVLAEASPAQIYFAATRDGVVPPDLMAHHDGLARDGIVSTFEEATRGKSAGWVSFVSMAGSSSPCVNATFQTNHCAHPSYADDLCYFNTSSNLQWNVPRADRYKAGYCLQTGQNKSWLYYREQGGSSSGVCNYFYLANFVWGSDSYYNGTKYSATTYRSYVWWRGSGSPKRAFYHFGGYGSGDVFDWGQRWTMGSCN